MHFESRPCPPSRHLQTCGCPGRCVPVGGSLFPRPTSGNACWVWISTDWLSTGLTWIMRRHAQPVDHRVPQGDSGHAV